MKRENEIERNSRFGAPQAQFLYYSKEFLLENPFLGTSRAAGKQKKAKKGQKRDRAKKGTCTFFLNFGAKRTYIEILEG